jgi:chromosome segregation and condensation protein ScpB
MDTTKQVLDAMIKAGKPVNAGLLVELTGLDKKEVDKAMNQLKKENKITSPKRCYWEPNPS